MEEDFKQQSIAEFTMSLLDDSPYNYLSDIDIYDYIEYKTNGFDTPRVKLIIKEMEFHYDIHISILEQRTLEEYKKQNKEIPYIKIKIIDFKHLKETGETIEDTTKNCYSPDFDKMLLKHLFFETINYNRVLNLLKSKLPSDIIDTIEKTTPKTSIITTNKQVEQIFNKAIEIQFITKIGEKYKWNKSKALLAYFISKISDEYNLSSNRRIKWKEFKPVFGYNNNDNSLSGALNDLQKTGNKPLEHDIIDNLFK